jgi:chromosome segregation ATPase
LRQFCATSDLTVRERNDEIAGLKEKVDQTRRNGKAELARLEQAHQVTLSRFNTLVSTLQGELESYRTKEIENEKASESLATEALASQKKLEGYVSELAEIKAQNQSKLDEVKLEYGRQITNLKDKQASQLRTREENLALQIEKRAKQVTEFMGTTLSEVTVVLEKVSGKVTDLGTKQRIIVQKLSRSEDQLTTLWTMLRNRDSEIQDLRSRLKEGNKRENQTRIELSSTRAEGEKRNTEWKKRCDSLTKELKVFTRL